MNDNWNYKSSDSQCYKIREWLLAGFTLTSLEALEMFGCMRLASRICDLRDRGMRIKAEKVMTHTGKYVTQYSAIQ